MAETIEDVHHDHGHFDWDASESLLGCELLLSRFTILTLLSCLGHILELAIEAIVTTVTKKSAVETTTAIWEFDPAAPGSLLDGNKADLLAMLRTLSVKVSPFKFSCFCIRSCTYLLDQCIRSAQRVLRVLSRAC